MPTIPGITMSSVLDEGKDATLLRARRGGEYVLLRSLRKDHPSSEEMARLRYGAELSRSLDVPGLLAVRSIEKRNHGLIVEFEDFDGATLRSVLAAGPLPIPRALDVAAQLARTLGALHERQVVHKNVEPANVLVHRRTGEVKLTNLDIASRLSRETQEAVSPSRLDGNLAYISPEQTGRMNRAVDYRTDFYSLGVTLYEMLTGRLPIAAADPMAQVHGHIAVVPEPPELLRTDLPLVISAIVRKLLAKNSEDRYQSAYGLSADLVDCRRQLELTGTIAYFAPGRHDAFTGFRLPQKLYGRESHIRSLVQTFERASAGAAELLVVSGYSGVGKSALVNEIHKPVVTRRGYFSAGKFDQLQTAPYGAFIGAFRGLVRQILTEGVAEVADWRARLSAALGANARVVLDVVPEVELVIGPQPEVAPLGPTESQHRFNAVFRQFVGALARPDHPLALFLDDLQWADAGSLGLLELILEETGLQHVLLIGAYRDNEVDEGHPLMMTLRKLRGGPRRLVELELSPLELGHVRQFVADATGGHDAGGLEGVAEVVFTKTEGNPFFVGQFLASLDARRLLSFDADSGRWAFDLPRIVAEPITENVALLMAAKLAELPERAQRALHLAAAIGHGFDLGTLAAVTGSSPADAAADLWEAVRRGFVVPVGEAYKYVASDADPASSRRPQVRYEFQHDRVQEIAYALAGERERQATHLRIGRLMLGRLTPAEREAGAFEVVNQLDRGAALVDDGPERLDLARLNLAAGRRAKTANAYVSALGYLAVGVDLLGDAGWEASFDLAFALHRQRAECLFLLGRMDESAAAFDIVFARARTRDEKIELFTLKQVLLQSIGRYEESLTAGVAALALHGLELPLGDQIGPSSGAWLRTVQAALASRDIASLADAPESLDPEDRTRVHLLAQTILYGGYAQMMLLQLLSMMLVQASLEHGNAPGSSVGYATFAAMLGRSMGDHAAAYELGKVALALAERFDDLGTRATVLFIVGAFVSPFRRPIRESFPLLDRAYVSALEGGALNFAGISSIQGLLLRIIAGEELGGVEALAQRNFDLMLPGADAIPLAPGAPPRQVGPLGASAAHATAQFRYFARLLRAGSIPEGSGPWLDEAFLVGRMAMHRPGLLSHHVLWLQKAVTYGDLARATEASARAQELHFFASGHIQQTELVFYQSLLLAALHAGATPEERAAQAQALAANLARLRGWAEGCPANFEAKRLLVEAEVARIEARDHDARDLYDQAIEAATASGFLPVVGLASERAAQHYLAAGRRRVARAYVIGARYAYARWGAEAKVRDLDQRYAELPALEAEGGGAAPASIDALAVVKASQAISSQIVLDDLLRQLMSTLLENAGAQRGCLILAGDPELVVEATGTGGAGAVSIRQRSADAAMGYSPAVVRYVERTRETVLLADAVGADPFQADPYIVERRPRSVLCMPILRQQRLVAVLYIENNLVTNAFTPERRQVLEVLSGQAAISIENARLYDTLEVRVAERTRNLASSNEELSRALRQLNATQQQLVAQEKLAALGALTAGIAHELKNPLNFISNFADLVSDLAVDIGGVVSAQRARIEADAVEELDDALGLLKQNVSRIAEHGKRANGIINGMLLHSRAGGAAKELADINAVLAESVHIARHGMRGGIGADVAVEASYDPAVGLVRVSSQDVSRVFVNVLDNAFYAMRQKGPTAGPGYVPRVVVDTRPVGEAVEVRIRDNGTGIPEDILGKIYNPFFTTKPPGEGAGLGLSISYDIVTQAHQGELRVETALGEFTEVIITLPRHGGLDGGDGA